MGVPIPVRLLRNVGRLGKAGEIVQVARGRMRNVLYPKKRAEYVLRHQGARDRRLDEI